MSLLGQMWIIKKHNLWQNVSIHNIESIKMNILIFFALQKMPFFKLAALHTDEIFTELVTICKKHLF